MKSRVRIALTKYAFRPVFHFIFVIFSLPDVDKVPLISIVPPLSIFLNELIFCIFPIKNQSVIWVSYVTHDRLPVGVSARAKILCIKIKNKSSLWNLGIPKNYLNLSMQWFIVKINFLIVWILKALLNFEIFFCVIKFYIVLHKFFLFTRCCSVVIDKTFFSF